MAVSAALSISTDHSALNLHEQVYSWEPKGVDVWGSIKSADDTSRIRDLLLVEFDPAKPPADRGLSKLKAAIDALREIVTTPEKTDWADAEETVEMDEDGINFRANTAAALFSQLAWLYEVFKHVPNASVTVR